MIIDARTVLTALKALGVTLAVWFVGMALLATMIEPPVVTAFGRTGAILADPSLKVIAMRPGIVTVAGEGHGWVRRLYANGAWFVWPINARECISLVRRFTK